MSLPARALFAGVRGYQCYLSPLKQGATCRFEPTCSTYAAEALQERGAVVGLLLTIARLSKCGPWHPGGYDPVPRKRGTRCSHTHEECAHG